MSKGLLIVVSGPSGVGKRTVFNYFIKREDLNLTFSISMTTRPKREGEIDKKDYYFVNDATFNKAIKEGALVEWAEFVGRKYGTPWAPIEKQRLAGKNVILEIEVLGALQLMERFKDIITVFLVPPSIAELERRLRVRNTETDAIIKQRIARATQEIKEKDKYGYVVVNDTAERAAEEIAFIIKKEINANK